MTNLDKKLAEVLRLRAEGKISEWPTDEQRADWAYGNAVIENEEVTREMAEEATRSLPPRR